MHDLGRELPGVLVVVRLHVTPKILLKHDDKALWRIALRGAHRFGNVNPFDLRICDDG